MNIRKLVKRLRRARKRRPATIAPADHEHKKTNPDVSPVEPITITSVETYWGYRN